MKLKATALFALFLFSLGSFPASADQYGFTGEFMEVKLADLSSRSQGDSILQILDTADTSKVKALAVGAKKLTAPVSPYSPHFVYYAYNLIAIDEWWISIIVANWDDSDHVVTVEIEVQGVLQTSIFQEFNLEANSAKLFSAKVELPPKIGMFHFRGKVTGETINTSSVKSKLLIFDAL
jgi:hypothetical protein